MSKVIKVKPVYYYEEDGYKMVTDDRECAVDNHKFQLANLDDLNDMSCTGLYFRDFIVETVDGHYVWHENTYETCLDENMECGYVKVDI